MRDIQLLFCIISLFAGVASISISYFIYDGNQKKSLKFFIGLNLSFFAIQNAITLKIYSNSVIHASLFIQPLSKLLDIIGSTSSCLLGLFFVNYIFGLEITKIKKVSFFSISIIQLILIAIYNLVIKDYIFIVILRSSMILIIIYQIIIVMKNYKQIKNNDLKKAIKFLMLITLIFFPFIIIESYRASIPFIKNIELLKMLALPSYFLSINIFSLIFALKYFNTPAFIADNKLTDYFKQKYEITEKEGQVIELIIEGKTYKEVAEILFISPKTVDNHIQNIYKKLNVKSKMQLSNFVRSN